MKKGIFVLMSAVLCPFMGFSADDNYQMLDDCEGDIQWSSNYGKLTKSDDASHGKQALKLKIDKPCNAELRFDGFTKGKTDLSKYDLIAFDYKLSGSVDYLDFVIRQYPLNAGRKGNYYPIDQADIRDKWATKILPLDGPENLAIHLDYFDTKARELYFRFAVKPGMKSVELLIDNVRVMKNPLGVRPITFGKYFRQQDGSVLYQYSIPAKNSGTKPITVKISPRLEMLKKFKANIGLKEYLIAPGGEEKFNVSVLIPAEVMKKSEPYSSEELVVDVELSNLPGLKLPTRLIAAVPPKKFVHPSLLGNAKVLAEIPAKAKRFPVVKKLLDNILKEAEKAIKNPLPIPDCNGWGITACLVDNTKLIPRQRKDVPHKEYVCPKCGRVYHGKFFDSGFSGAGGWYGTHMKLAGDVLNTAFAYRVTGDRRYGVRAAEIMKGYADKYLSYDMIFPNDQYWPLGANSPSSRRICGWHFMENRWLQHMSIAYDLLYGTEVFSEKDAEYVKLKALLPAAQKTTENEVGLNNIQLPHSLAQICSGFALDDPVLVYYGTKESRGVLSNIKHNILDDGTWAESPNYINLVAHELPPFLYILNRIGLKVYTKTVLRLFTEIPKMGSPAGRQPNFGDGSGVAIKGWGDHCLLPYYDTKNPELGAILTKYPDGHLRGIPLFLYLVAYDGPPKEKPLADKLGCTDFPSSGYLFLRNQPEDMWFAMTYGRHIGHGHWDRFGFELYGGGNIQAIDDGAGPYDKYHDEFDVRTLAHNTMLVDMKNQKPGKGYKLAWKVDGEVKLASVGSDQLYDGVWYERNVAMLPEAVLLVDYLKSDKEHVYDWAYHNLGKIVSGPKTQKTKALADKGMYSYLKDLSKTDASKGINIIFRQGKEKWEKEGTGLKLSQLAVPGTELYEAKTGHGYHHDHIASTLISRRKAKDTVYITLLEPLAKGAEPHYKITDSKRENDKVIVNVSDGKNSWRLTVNLGDITKDKIAIK
jgi:hypothetical protein